MLTYITAGTQSSNITEVYVSRKGHDSASCGQIKQPCKSIEQAVRRVEWNGHIYLDGTGTERDPYDCSRTILHGQPATGFKVQKNLSMEGIEATPHICCPDGFQFQSTNTELSIVLSGIVFRRTPLIFQHCNLIKVFNCSFRDAPTALTVCTNNSKRTQLDIRGDSYFENNTSCMEIFASNNSSQSSLKLSVSDTVFQANGRFGSSLAKGAITITSCVKKTSSIAYVEISCFRVKYNNNLGYFVSLDLLDAISKEEYWDVTLVDNSAPRFMRPFGKAVKSLYTSRARKTRVEFINLSCSHNQFLRCLKFQSDKAEVKINNSSFVGQSIPADRGAAIYLEAKTYATLVVLKSRFRRNRAKSGGALFVHSKHGLVELTMTQVNFTECVAEKQGCAILVGSPRTLPFTNRTATYELLANLREVRVQNCFGVRHGKRKCIVFHFLIFNGNLNITDSSWTNNINLIDAALMIGNAGGKTDIAISRCTFIRNFARLQGAVLLAAIREQAGNVTVENTTFSNQEDKTNNLFVSPEYRIRIMNVLFNFSKAIGLAIFRPAKTKFQVIPVNIYIYNCVFLNNAHDIVVSLWDLKKVKFTIINTIFTSKMANYKDLGTYFYVGVLKRLNLSTDAIVELNNVTFVSRPANILKLLFLGNKTVKIQRSSFRDGICLRQYVFEDNFYQVGTGAITVVFNRDKLNSSGCVEKQTNENIHPSWHYDTQVLFEDTTFEGNAGLLAGAVYTINGNVTFNRCNFRNNFATQRSGHVYSAYGTGQVNFKDCLFSTSMNSIKVNDTIFDKSTFLYSESGGPVIFENTKMVSAVSQRSPFAVMDISSGGYVHVDNRSSIDCSTGSQLLFENNTHFSYVYNEKNDSTCRVNVTVLKYSCNLCSPGYYSLQRGVSDGLYVHSSLQCLSCPFGATCIEKNIAAKPDFWGYKNSDHPSSLNFYACPEHYCRSPSSDSKDYNSCYGNRTGFLCGKCAPEYGETLFSTECRKGTECNNYLLWTATVLYTTAIAFYLLIKPPVLRFLGRHILWFRKRVDDSVRQELGPVDKHSDSGYLKITFYFYQAAELLIVGSAEHLLHHKIPFVISIVEAFNFEVRSLHKLIDCPFAGLTAVTKELLLSGTVFLILSEITVIFCLRFAFNKIRRKERPSVIHYIAVVIELLLLGYERLAETAFKLMHCVSIASEKRLFIDAEIVCWQWWQYIIVAYIVVSVIPFIMVLYFGSSKLHKSSISAKEFLGACICPLPFLVYWLLKKTVHKTRNVSENQQNNKDILEVLHDPFRQPRDGDNGTLYWESVLIGRRFILLCCHAFIANSMFKMVCMTIICVLILLHHVFKNPYHDPIANNAETSSLLALVVMAVINLTKATLVSFGTSIAGPTKSYLEALEWFEICALAFIPTLLAIFLVFAILSQLVRLIVFLAKLMSNFVQWGLTKLHSSRELARPILNISEAD